MTRRRRVLRRVRGWDANSYELNAPVVSALSFGPAIVFGAPWILLDSFSTHAAALLRVHSSDLACHTLSCSRARSKYIAAQSHHTASGVACGLHYREATQMNTFSNWHHCHLELVGLEGRELREGRLDPGRVSRSEGKAGRRWVDWKLGIK